MVNNLAALLMTYALGEPILLTRPTSPTMTLRIPPRLMLPPPPSFFMLLQRADQFSQFRKADSAPPGKA